MTVSKLRSGRWRSQIWHKGRWIPVASVIGGPSSFPTKKEARHAKADAERALGKATEAAHPITVGEFRDRWLSDPLFARPKESTMRHNAERTRAFAVKYGTVPLSDVADFIVAEWLRDGKNRGTIPALRAMFNDARSAKAGRLIAVNPFAGLGVSRGKGNAQKNPPSEEQVWAMIRHAQDMCPPSYAGWLQVACFTGLRPGELDALRWDAVDFDGGWIHVREQWSAAVRKFTTPKNGKQRVAPLTPPARGALLALAEQRPEREVFCFTTLRGSHYTPSSRAFHWNTVRAASGWKDSLYLATRHHAGSYMVNVLGLDSEDVAFALGHEDGGELVRRLYGHRDRMMALARVKAAFERTANVKPLHVVRKDTA